MKYPRITIFTISFNGGKYIEECFKSIKNQNYKNWEWLFIDDGSNDETQSIIESIKNNYNVKYYRLEENVGRGQARNFGLTKIETDYIVLLDVDDLMTPNRLEEYYKSIIKGFDVFISASYTVSKSNMITGIRPAIFNQIFNLFTHATLCLKSEILKEIKYANYRHAEDQQVISTIRRAKSIYLCSKPLYIYREEESINLQGAISSNYYAFLINLKSLRSNFSFNQILYIASFLLNWISLKAISLLKKKESLYTEIINKRKRKEINTSLTLQEVLNDHGK